MRSEIYFKRLFVTLMAVTLVHLIFLPPTKAAEERPLVASLNERIETEESAVVVEKVVIYPNERTLYGPGDENYGMPVKEEYGKGPIVVLKVEKSPDYRYKRPFGEWVEAALFSDGRRLGQSISGGIGSKRVVFGFNFFVEVDMDISPDGAVELKELGDLALEVTLSRVENVVQIPLHSLPRGKEPLFEDEDVKIWEVKWGERVSKSRKNTSTTLRIRFESKTESAIFGINWLGREDAHLGAVSEIDSWYEHVKRGPMSQFSEVQFWKIVPLKIERFKSLKFEVQ